MKRKDGFNVEKVGDFFYLFPVGECVDGRIFSMNDTCKYVWDLLERDQTESQIITSVANYYSVESEIVSDDVKVILSEMCKAGVVEL